MRWRRPFEEVPVAALRQGDMVCLPVEVAGQPGPADGAPHVTVRVVLSGGGRQRLEVLYPADAVLWRKRR